MTKLLDKICKVRDLVTSKDYGKLKFYNMQILKLKEEINRQITKKENSQALTELLNLVEFYAVFLYMVEEASNDKFALKYTERF